MKVGIIAAGKGERLARGGIAVPKPLVVVDGQPLIARIITAAARLGATSSACIVNAETPDTAHYLRSRNWPLPLELIVQTTPSSMESLFCLEPLLSVDEEPFLLCTVDAVFGFSIIADFVRQARQVTAAHGVLALTDYIDDEKPLWAAVDNQHKITAMGQAAEGSRYVTAGFYYFAPTVFSEIATARAHKLNALRQFLGLLLEKGYGLYGVPVPKTLDVDYPEDIAKADAYLKEIEDP